MALDKIPNTTLFTQRDVRETPAGTSSSTSSSTIIAPIGTIMAWLKSYTNTPQTLPTGWVECDGSVVNDADSVYNTQTLPDLNGGEFLRGDTTSGGTGGSATHTLIEAEMPAHTHNFQAGGTATYFINSYNATNTAAGGGINITSLSGALTGTQSAGSGTAHENRPPFYNVVWIMRIK